MGHGMIDGDRWIGERLAFLRGVLTTDISDEQRKMIEDEIQKLSKERGIHIGGFRLPLFPSRWIGRRRHATTVPPSTTTDPHSAKADPASAKADPPSP